MKAHTLWAGQTVEQAQADDVRELLNYREAFNLVSDYLQSGEPVTEGPIREIHKRLVGGVGNGRTSGALTLGDLERRFPEVNRRTLQRDTKGMLDKGLLREVGTGRTDPNRRYVSGEL